MFQVSRRQGFTLIELLVVIAIIAILAGLLLPALSSVRKKGFETKARTEVKAIEMAIKAYLNEYNRFPLTNGVPDVVYGDNNSQIMGILRGTNVTYNPRMIVFLEGSEGSFDESGNMIDPWSAPYNIALDTDYDNEVDTISQGVVPGRNVAVWSIGSSASPDESNRIIKSW